ncbi:MAG: PEGA domain-containing protein [Proteobacteria bacterium]|nr:PEGA domain-containing protein [Pseudomonadota bacterium]
MTKTTIAALACLLLLTACGPPKQTIPISTNPLGALVYADGVKACTTPCSISLAKTSEHLLTVVKDGYDQVDLTVTRQFRPDKPIRDAAIGAILTGDPKVAAGKVAKEVDEQEKSGEAYVLEPSIITITLTPTVKIL